MEEHTNFESTAENITKETMDRLKLFDENTKKTREAISRDLEPNLIGRYFIFDLEHMPLIHEIVRKQKVYTLCTENIFIVLEYNMNVLGYFKFDEFTNVLMANTNGTWRPLEEVDTVFVQTKISELFPPFAKVPKGMVFDAMMKLSMKNKYDSAKDYVTGLKWDNVARLDTWLCSTYGVEDNKYHRAVASNWMKGMVKRIIDPGCKFDYVMVLEGKQGAKKSMSLNILGGSWYVETTMSTDSKDFFMQFHGKVIVEFSEGETLSRTEVKRMKAIITTQSDKYRPPYERVSKDFPRRCVFAMTTNQDEYLKDETGNRRWFPVRVVKDEADTDWLKEHRDQLFAEAYHRLVALKETIWEFPKEESIIEQNARRIKDPNEDLIIEWYWNALTDQQRAEGIVPYQVFQDCLHHGFSGPMKKYEEMEICNVLKMGLRLIKVRKSFQGRQTNRWYNEKSVVLDALVEKSMVKQEMEF